MFFRQRSQVRFLPARPETRSLSNRTQSRLSELAMLACLRSQATHSPKKCSHPSAARAPVERDGAKRPRVGVHPPINSPTRGALPQDSHPLDSEFIRTLTDRTAPNPLRRVFLLASLSPGNLGVGLLDSVARTLQPRSRTPRLKCEIIDRLEMKDSCQ